MAVSQFVQTVEPRALAFLAEVTDVATITHLRLLSQTRRNREGVERQLEHVRGRLADPQFSGEHGYYEKRVRELEEAIGYLDAFTDELKSNHREAQK
jgi:hypothetical protein